MNNKEAYNRSIKKLKISARELEIFEIGYSAGRLDELIYQSTRKIKTIFIIIAAFLSAVITYTVIFK